MRTSDGALVTPEAVRLDFELATLGSRAVSAVIDLAIVWAGLLLFLLLLTAAAAGAAFEGPVAIVLVLLFFFLILWGYPTVLETFWRGKTVGKAAMGLRVVTGEGGPVRFRHAAIRAVLGIVDFYVSSGAVAVLTALLSRRHQRLGDIVAGTIVVRERTGAPAPRPVVFQVPPGWQAYAATLDPAGISARDHAAVRSFLLRAGQLRPEARAALAANLAGPLAARIGHVLPLGVPPEAFLVCIAARVQERGGGQPGWPQASPVARAQQPPPTQLPPPPPRAPSVPGDFVPPA